HAAKERVAAAVVEMEMRVDHAHDLARDPFRIATGMPLRLDERMGARHPRVDEHETVRVGDRVSEDWERAAEGLHVRDEMGRDHHLFAGLRRGNTQPMIGVGIALIIVGVIFLFIIPGSGSPWGSSASSWRS